MRKGSKHKKESLAKMAESLTGRKLTGEHKANIGKAKAGKNNPMYGRKHTDEAKAKNSKAKSGKNNPMYGRKGKDSPSYGKKRTAEQIAKKSGSNNHMYGIKGKDNPNYGRKNTAEAILNMSGSNNPQYGKKGKDSHMFGTKRTEEVKAKMSGKNHPMYGKRGKDNPNYGKKASAETLAKTSGINHWNYGRKASAETLAKMSGSNNWNYGKKASAETLAKMSGSNNHNYGKKGKDCPLYGRKHTAEHRANNSKAKSDSNNANWKGGIAAEPYCEIWLDKEYKESIKERDNYQCQNPDCWGKHKKLFIHHINYVKKDCHPNNLITLCSSCNSRANVNREHWQWVYERLVLKRGLKSPPGEDFRVEARVRHGLNNANLIGVWTPGL